MVKELTVINAMDIKALRERGIVGVCMMWGYDLEGTLEAVEEMSWNEEFNPGKNVMSVQVGVSPVVMDRGEEMLEDVVRRNGVGRIGGKYKVNAIFFEDEKKKEAWDKEEDVVIINNN